MDLSLDDLLSIVGNPVRRKILEKLARESHYPLQLSKELNVSQQAVMKHLHALERMNLVETRTERSESGPPRKYYIPTTRFTLIIDLGTNSFKAQVYSLQDRVEPPERCSDELKEFLKQYEEISKTRGIRVRFLKLSKLIEELNDSIQHLETDRNALLMLKSTAMRKAQELIMKFSDDYSQRTLLYYLLEQNKPDLESISEHLNMRIKVITQLVEELIANNLPIDELIRDVRVARARGHPDQSHTAQDEE